MASHINDLKDNTLIKQVADDQIRKLEKESSKKVRSGQAPIPMSEFAKILIWEKEQLCDYYAKENYKRKLDGWDIVEHIWYGIPMNEAIKHPCSLH